MLYHICTKPTSSFEWTMPLYNGFWTSTSWKNLMCYRVSVSNKDVRMATREKFIIQEWSIKLRLMVTVVTTTGCLASLVLKLNEKRLGNRSSKSLYWKILLNMAYEWYWHHCCKLLFREVIGSVSFKIKPTANTLVEVVVEEYMSRFGGPQSIHDDQGRNFGSLLFKEMCGLDVSSSLE